MSGDFGLIGKGGSKDELSCPSWLHESVSEVWYHKQGKNKPVCELHVHVLNIAFSFTVLPQRLYAIRTESEQRWAGLFDIRAAEAVLLFI